MPPMDNEREMSLQLEDLTPLEFFDDYSDVELREIIPYLKLCRYKPEEGPIFGEDLRNKGIQIILEGEVKVVKSVGDDEGIVLATLHRGDIIGEASMFDEVPHTATVETSEPATTISIARDTYFRLVEEKPHLAVKIANRAAAVLSDRLHQANEAVYTYAIWSRSLSQSPPESFWYWQALSTRENLLTRDLDANQEEEEEEA